LRLFLIGFGILLVALLLGYAVSRDRRWLRYAGLTAKLALALFLILGLLYLARRLILL
ncbi:MAG: hypothetical protein HXY26_10805, partial [Hydrogenophilaceae bacterium]|nr:hypothetical protein [Hydrogenophilaceae bacterium]